MKKTILLCDLCPEDEVHVADDRLRIAGLLEQPLQVDVCGDHRNSILDAVKGAMKNGHANGNGSNGHKTNGSGPSLVARVVEWFETAPPGPHGAGEVAEAFGIERRNAASALVNILKGTNPPLERVDRGLYQLKNGHVPSDNGHHRASPGGGVPMTVQVELFLKQNPGGHGYREVADALGVDHKVMNSTIANLVNNDKYSVRRVEPGVYEYGR